MSSHPWTQECALSPDVPSLDWKEYLPSVSPASMPLPPKALHLDDFFTQITHLVCSPTGAALPLGNHPLPPQETRIYRQDTKQTMSPRPAESIQLLC